MVNCLQGLFTTFLCVRFNSQWDIKEFSAIVYDEPFSIESNEKSTIVFRLSLNVIRLFYNLNCFFLITEFLPRHDFLIFRYSRAVVPRIDCQLAVNIFKDRHIHLPSFDKNNNNVPNNYTIYRVSN